MDESEATVFFGVHYDVYIYTNSLRHLNLYILVWVISTTVYKQEQIFLPIYFACDRSVIANGQGYSIWPPYTAVLSTGDILVVFEIFLPNSEIFFFIMTVREAVSVVVNSLKYRSDVLYAINSMELNFALTAGQNSKDARAQNGRRAQEVRKSSRRLSVGAYPDDLVENCSSLQNVH